MEPLGALLTVYLPSGVTETFSRFQRRDFLGHRHGGACPVQPQNSSWIFRYSPRPSSRDLWTSTKPRIENYFGEPNAQFS